MSTKSRTDVVGTRARASDGRTNGAIGSPERGSIPGGFGAFVRERRAELGLSMDAVGARAACSKSYLSAIENGKCGPPSGEILRGLEAALELERGALDRLAGFAATPPAIRRELASLQDRQRAASRLAEMLRSVERPEGGGPRGTLDEAFRTGELRKLIDRMSPPEERGVEAVRLPVEVPVINKVAAGYPRDFTDLGYPVGVADEYVRTPDLADPDAFAARVVGDSMTPDYREGDVVIFSPARDVRDGADCFARLAPDDEATFKRVYFEAGEGGAELIRLQPLNSAYPARTLEREQVVGLFAAVSVLREIL